MNQTLEQYQSQEIISWNEDEYFTQIIPNLRVEDQFDLIFECPQ